MNTGKSACSVCFASGLELGKSCSVIKEKLSLDQMPPVVQVVEMIAAVGAADPCEIDASTVRPYLHTFMLAYEEADIPRMKAALEDILVDMTYSEIARASLRT